MAEDWHLGIKVSFSNATGQPLSSKDIESLKYPLFGHIISSRQKFTTQASEEIDQLYSRFITFPFWNPWFGASLYVECAFNEHVGVATELLYTRFAILGQQRLLLTQNLADKLQNLPHGLIPFTKDNFDKLVSWHTIGLPLMLTWYWTAALRPNFKDDWFLGRFFVGVHSIVIINSGIEIKNIDTASSNELRDSYQKFSDRLKFGFIGGFSFEVPDGILIEFKNMLPYSLWYIDKKDDRPLLSNFHLSIGYNFAKV